MNQVIDDLPGEPENQMPAEGQIPEAPVEEKLETNDEAAAPEAAPDVAADEASVGT